MYIAYGRGSVLLWRRCEFCNTLCTYDSVNDVRIPITCDVDAAAATHRRAQLSAPAA